MYKMYMYNAHVHVRYEWSSVMPLFFTKEEFGTLAEAVSPWEELVASDLGGRVKLLLTCDVLAGRDDNDMRGRDRTSMLANRKQEKVERERERQRDREKQRKTETETERERDREKQKETDTKGVRDRQTEAETKKETDGGSETKAERQRCEKQQEEKQRDKNNNGRKARHNWEFKTANWIERVQVLNYTVMSDVRT